MCFADAWSKEARRLINLCLSKSEDEPGTVIVDCHVRVAVNQPRVMQYRDELVAMMNNYPEPERLKGGPSYIEVGGVIGDQMSAFMLFGIGERAGFWKVITPATLGVTGKEAGELAGRGFVMISGYNPEGSIPGTEIEVIPAEVEIEPHAIPEV